MTALPGGLVVVPVQTLTELVTQAVAAGLGGRAAEPAALLAREGIARALDVSTATIDRLVRRGMPHVLVGEAKRFELSQVLEWLRSRKRRGDDGPQ